MPTNRNFRRTRPPKTANYSMFEHHPMNRKIRYRADLEESMRRHGFMPSNPIQCVENGSGKLKIIRGHHRFETAKRLGIPVYYVIDDSCTELFELERPGQTWSSTDFAIARAQAGHKDCQTLLRFSKAHELPLSTTAGLLRGVLNTGSATRAIKQGTFEVRDERHAREVARVIDVLRDGGVDFATNGAFAAALSLAMRVEGFDPDVLISKFQRWPRLLARRSRRDEYLEEIESLYNTHAKKVARLAIAFEAKNILRQIRAEGRKKGNEANRKKAERVRAKKSRK